jgi:branched-chain amino acid aminotransferase
MNILNVQEIMSNSPAHVRREFQSGCEAGIAFVDGKFVPFSEARIPIGDVGFAHADAAYDVTTSTRGYVFKLDRHIERFLESCAKFRMICPISPLELRTILLQLCAKSGLSDSFIWWCVTRGDFPPGLAKIDPKAYAPRFYAYVIPYRFYADDSVRRRGLDIFIAESRYRIPEYSVDPTAKNFHWMDMKLAMFEAHDNGYDWSVLTDSHGLLTEAPGSNIFFVKDKVLCTPKKGCLEGITRETAMEIATEIGVEVSVGDFPKDMLFDAEEAFLTSSAGGVIPINSVNRKQLGIPGPGPLTTRIHNLYWEKRWQGWHGTLAKS